MSMMCFHPHLGICGWLADDHPEKTRIKIGYPTTLIHSDQRRFSVAVRTGRESTEPVLRMMKYPQILRLARLSVVTVDAARRASELDGQHSHG